MQISIQIFRALSCKGSSNNHSDKAIPNRVLIITDSIINFKLMLMSCNSEHKIQLSFQP